MITNIQIPKLRGHNESGAEGKVHSTKCLYIKKKLERFHTSNLTAHLEALNKRSKHTQEEGWE